MKANLNNLTSLTNETSAIGVINSNNTTIQTALENTLSRDGTGPNNMAASLDMNSNRIINLPDAVNEAEPATFGQLQDAISGVGSGAIINASYVTLNADPTLLNERRLTAGSNISVVDGGANQNVTINVSSAELNALAAVASAADKLPYYTGVGAASTTDFTSFARTLLDDSDAAAARSTLGVSIGGAVQAWDSDLDALSSQAGTGLLARTGAGTATTRTVTGTANEISVSNGNGVSGNPTVSLPSSLTFTGKTVTGGSFASPAITTPTGIVKGDVGLGNVDNTSDANKPVSTAQQTALNLKANLASPALTGTPTAPTAANGTNTTQIATTAFVLANAASAGVASLNGQTGALTISVAPQGRLTLTSGVAVMVGPQLAATTVYYTPSVGNQIPLYDGTRFVPTVFTELSMLTTDTTKSPAAVANNSNYDLFVWNDSGTLRLSRGPVWTNDTTRSAGTALTMLNGIYVNNVSITNGPAAQRGTYVGTMRSNGTATVDMQFGGTGSGGVAGYFMLWNAYNRTQGVANVIDNQAAYANSSGTIRVAGNSNLNTVRYVCGLVEDTFSVSYRVRHDVTAASGGAFSYVALGFDSLSAYSFNRMFAKSQASGSVINTPQVNYDGFPSLGYHYIAALESADGANSTSMNAESNGRLTYVGWW